METWPLKRSRTKIYPVNTVFRSSAGRKFNQKKIKTKCFFFKNILHINHVLCRDKYVSDKTQFEWTIRLQQIVFQEEYDSKYLYIYFFFFQQYLFSLQRVSKEIKRIIIFRLNEWNSDYGRILFSFINPSFTYNFHRPAAEITTKRRQVFSYSERRAPQFPERNRAGVVRSAHFPPAPYVCVRRKEIL